MTDAFGGKRTQVRPPERGIFPLDHDGECRAKMISYLACLEENRQDYFPCREFSKAYLSCRMDVGLMAKEDLKSLGLGDVPEYERLPSKEGERSAQGFIAGTGVKISKTSWFNWK